MWWGRYINMEAERKLTRKGEFLLVACRSHPHLLLFPVPSPYSVWPRSFGSLCSGCCWHSGTREVFLDRKPWWGAGKSSVLMFSRVTHSEVSISCFDSLCFTGNTSACHLWFSSTNVVLSKTALNPSSFQTTSMFWSTESFVYKASRKKKWGLNNG